MPLWGVRKSFVVEKNSDDCVTAKTLVYEGDYLGNLTRIIQLKTKLESRGTRYVVWSYFRPKKIELKKFFVVIPCESLLSRHQ